ncbi:Alcohol dehydrogenase [acceptor] [Streptomyces sp. YIM 130001]|uniref:GMC family oxidoreductase n=1 Tax=Streptomyces sp. YIM 130001 TaxID=2259644 RepID=UPI000E64B94F|nr:GMC family oxidoreductase N-terminal domain-containing protein [Streptomyces sp. YIM 130001]RII07942.1 Alcohol dehydrogenase [acceptor] [Streptomyces sp. YIM 130001]
MYDYVIVGGGSAGCVLAARLSEDPDIRVCLVEAGPMDSAEQIHIPAAFAKLFRTRLDWDYDSHDEPYMNRRRVYLPRGKVVGGTSSINTQIYIRGNQADYDAWQQPGWSFDELLPYFKRSEGNERGPSRFHGADGPMAVSEGRAGNPMSTAFLEAATAAGYPANDDFNGSEQDGFGAFQLTQQNGMRVSTATAFLHPALSRPNLTVETNVQVHRVLFEGSRAVGITGHRLDEEVTFRAEREVVLSAGTYNSPQLLMLSGIGPAGMLRALGLPVVLDQPQVGQNLQDHVLIPLIYPHEHPISMLAAGQPEHIEQFQTEGRGPLTSNGPEVGGFVRSDPGLPAPDLEYLAAPVMFVDNGLGVPDRHALTFGPSLLTPRSRGSVSLASEDPTAKPRIVHNYFAENDDLRTAVTSLRIGLDIANQVALKPYTSDPFRPPASTSDADLRAYTLRYAHSIFHPTSTCAMGSVVDEQLRVTGVDGLRVVDASVMPTVVRGNTNAPVIAIAEKGADLIRGLQQPAETTDDA